MSTSESFPHRLLLALASREPPGDADALASEALVRMGNATRANVIRVAGPDELAVHECCFDSASGITHTSTRIRQSFSAILSDTALASIGPASAVGEERRVIRPPVTGVAVVADFRSDTLDGGTAELDLTDSLSDIITRLLERSDAGLCEFPDDRHLEAMAEFAAGAGHEINNPLGSILGQTALLLKTETSIERRQALETIGGQGWRIRDMIGNTMLFARPPAVSKTPVSPNAVVRELLHAIRQQHAFRQVRFDFAADPANHQLNADVTQLNSLFSYLIRNAADAVQDDKDDAVVEVSLRYDDRHDALEFAVRDSSRRKLTPVELRHMFDPFFSGHSAGRGLGFGLSLAWQIVRQHRGVIFCCAPDAGGLQSYVALPVETD